MIGKRHSRPSLQSELAAALAPVSVNPTLSQWASRVLAGFAAGANREAPYMEQAHTILAEFDGFGRVYRCGGCEHIHLQMGPVNVTLTPAAYLQFVAMVNSSAARFETAARWELGGI